MRAVAGLDADGGAQPQRTMLAWSRTLLATVLGCAAVAFAAQRQGMPLVAALAGLASLGVLVLVLRDLRGWQPGAGSYPLMRRVAAAVVLLAALGSVVAIRGVLT